MKRLIYDLKRTHRCGSLRESHCGETVVLMGWVHNRRDHGGCVFIDLRDREGVTQVIFDPQVNAEAHGLAGDLRSEWVIGVRGKVRSRGGNANPKLPTGAVEVEGHLLEVFASAKPPPFPVEENVQASEEVRLKHRFLDLRRPTLQHNLRLRHRFNKIVRQCLDEAGFLELETPFLVKSTPEGARDYVVPSRVHAGKFFALPQSPQLFKQLLMVSGYDRYFQIVRCFRDEDLRAERQPEFTQVDVEMSFCAPEDVQSIIEEVITRVFKELAGVEIPAPFERIAYDEAIARFGLDAPDMRYGLELCDVTALMRDSGFRVFADTVDRGGVVKAINLREAGELSRKELEDLGEFVKIYGAKGLAWVRVKETGEWQSPIAKYFDESRRCAIADALQLKAGDVAVFVADTPEIASTALGQLRKQVASMRRLAPDELYRFCWVTEFPQFEWDPQTQRYYAAHHPFTSPRPEDVDKLESDPGGVKAMAYDLVLNGVEIGGGSIRIHDSGLQQRLFRALGICKEEAQRKFGFLLDALEYGAPPHGGIALGVDRIMMLLCHTASIRDVIAFPKTQRQTDLMLDAPSSLDPEQLIELSLRTVSPSNS